MKRIAILQSNYIPWKGYVDLIGAVDEFVFYDDAQFTKNDWRHRNRIKTPQGPQWLSIPVGAAIHRSIREVQIVDPACGEAHWTRLVANYARARHFRSIATWLEPLYRDAPWTSLSGQNRSLLGGICRYLEIGTCLSDVATYAPEGDRNARLVSLCRQAGASTYVSGPAAQAYLDVASFEEADVAVEWFDYAGYAPYPQLWGPFVHEVSILDLLFNCGPDARRHMRIGAQ